MKSILSFLLSFLDKVSAALVGVVVGYFVKVGSDKLRAITAAKVVKRIFRSGLEKVFIIHSAIYDQNRRAYSYPSCDLETSRRIATLFEKAGLKQGQDFEIHPDPVDIEGSIKSYLRQSSLVLICGPKRNATLKAILENAPNLRYSLYVNVHTGKNEIRDTYRDEVLTSSREKKPEDGDNTGYDYALIQGFPHPWNLDNRVTVIAGIHSTGTLGAGLWIESRSNLRSIASESKHGIFEDLIVVRYKDGIENITETTKA